MMGTWVDIRQSKLQLPEDVNLEHSEARSRLRLGLFSYPVLQAADILVHRFDIKRSLIGTLANFGQSDARARRSGPEAAP